VRRKVKSLKDKKNILSKYLTKNKSDIKKEIDTYAIKGDYKTKWDSDYKSDRVLIKAYQKIW
jgi:hypothetical protein